MPQITSGQIVPGQNGAPKLYGTEKNENTIPFQERLSRLFKPQEFVTIKNIDDEPLYWQFMPADSETENFSEDGMQRIITREQPEMWVILPGEAEVIVGASAYRALDTLYKNYMAKSTLRKFKDPESPMFTEDNKHLPKNFNFADGGAQEEFIKKAYLGKAQLAFTTPVEQPVVMPETVTAPLPVEEIDPTIPRPKTTEGAPLEPVTYAQPDTAPAKSAKELVNAGSKK
jgi:hypothetical protein